MFKFTVEETNLMCCFDTSSRSKLISEMKKLLSKELDSDIAELICKTVRKLENMTDDEFGEQYIAPDGMIDD